MFYSIAQRKKKERAEGEKQLIARLQSVAHGEQAEVLRELLRKAERERVGK